MVAPRVICNRLISLLMFTLITSQCAAAESKAKKAQSSDMMMGASARMSSVAPYPKFGIDILIQEIKNKQKKSFKTVKLKKQ